MNENKIPMYEAIPAVASLNQVPGFNPLKFLRRTSSKDNEPVLQLDLRYKKLWFRLANPQGRIRFANLHLSDQLAIIEAKIYLNRNDTEPISSFTARSTIAEQENYIEAAQHTALNEALSIAGFGLQFADISVGNAGEPYGSTVPLTGQPATPAVAMELPKAPEERPAALPAEQSLPVTTTTNESRTGIKTSGAQLPTDCSDINSGQQTLPAKPSDIDKSNEPGGLLPADIPDNTAAQQALPAAPIVTVPVPDSKTASIAAEETQRLPADSTTPTNPLDNHVIVLNGGKEPEPNNTFDSTKEALAVMAGHTAATIAVPNDPKPSPEPTQSAVPPAYTADMPVEQIVGLMNADEAGQILVDIGTCKGWTMAQVAERRAPSLRWYVYGYQGNNNILRAAAQVMLNSLDAQKAS